MRDAFSLDPSITHLNHGSFGALPRVVAKAQQRVRDRAEATPLHRGRRTQVWQTRITDESGRLLAQTVQTQLVLD